MQTISTTRLLPVPTKAVTRLDNLPDNGDPFQFQNLADVQVKEIEWVWKPYIPRGALTMLMGDGGYGKSWLTCSLAADLSAGRPLPGQVALNPQRILMIGAEDGLSQVIKPKMISLRANMLNIDASDKGFEINGKALSYLVKRIRDYDAAIVFMDPLVVYMGGRIDMHRANEARSVLNLLSEVAQDTNTAIVVVHHVRKSGDGPAQHKVMGSADFVNGVRSGLLVDISKGGQRYMAHVKSNWAANGPTLAYTFGSEGFKWLGEYAQTDTEDKPQISKTKRGEVQNWLRVSLSEGPVQASEMMQAALENGYNERTIARAKLGIVFSYNIGGVWMWRLSDQAVTDMRKAEDEKIQRDMSPPVRILESFVGKAPEADLVAEAKRILAEKRLHG